MNNFLIILEIIIKLLIVHFFENETLEDSINRIKKESEIAVRKGITQLVLSDKNVSIENCPVPMLLCVGAINTHLIKQKLRGLCFYKCSIWEKH